MYCYFQTFYDQQQALIDQHAQILNAVKNGNQGNQTSPIPTLMGMGSSPSVAAARPIENTEDAIKLGTPGEETIAPLPQKMPLIGDSSAYAFKKYLRSAKEIFSNQLAEIDTTEDLSRVRGWRPNVVKDTSLTPEAAVRLKEWFTSDQPNLLYLRGSIRSQKVPNPVTSLSANIIRASQLSGLPTFFRFCGLKLHQYQSGYPQAVILQVIIVQALEWLVRSPNVEAGSLTMSASRCAKALVSTKELWALLYDILLVLPKPLVILIDLLESYEDNELEFAQLIQGFMLLVDKDRRDFPGEIPKGFRKLSDSPLKNMKILITSKHFSASLENGIAARLTVNMYNARYGRNRRQG
ncbi:hypothetical protein MMC25_003154 [Agyrium rufum]|nr:hypothetical protein [Agyrium rufum]